MNKRSMSAIIFGVIVFVEIILFVSLPNITKEVSNGSKGLFRFDTVSDNEATQNRNMKYGVVIFGTILIGSLITFTLPVMSPSKDNANDPKQSQLKKGKTKNWTIGIIAFLAIYLLGGVILDIVLAMANLNGRYASAITFVLGLLALWKIVTQKDDPEDDMKEIKGTGAENTNIKD